tara:strand:+ start:136 stop:678 length:543 start_codon:yes stop_codon:yes gene_type:complete
MHLYNSKIYYFFSEFNKKHLLNINNKINLIFRNYDKDFSIKFYEELRTFCQKAGFKIYLANNTKIANSLEFDGAYLPSFNKEINYTNINKIKNFKLLGSAHDIKDIKIKEKQGVELLFLSPVFKRKNKRHLKIYNFLRLSKSTNIETAALGGINSKNIKLLNLYGVKNIGSINWIKKIYG